MSLSRLQRIYRTIWERMGYVRPCGICRCCGNLVVWLPRRGAKDNDDLIPVYLKTWNGDPFYSEIRHSRHRKGSWERFQEGMKNPDPMLELEGNPPTEYPQPEYRDDPDK